MATPQPLTLEAHLQTLFKSPNTHPQLRNSVLPNLLQAIGNISSALRGSARVSQVGTANAFGDDQLNVDVLAENILRQTISQTPSIVTASSEEDPIERPAQLSSAQNRKSSGERAGQAVSNEAAEAQQPQSQAQETYTLAFDPLDGSSIIAPNWTVGTILGIWSGPSALHHDPATSQIGSILGVFGPRTTALVALRIPGACDPTCFEIGYSVPREAAAAAHGIIEVLRREVTLDAGAPATRYFAPANLRAAAEDEAYRALISHFIAERYTLRYSGGLVPDVVHALVKGHGVYVSPVTKKSKAKLRRLYELAPVALVVECAGGMAIDAATGERILSREVRDTDERAGLVCGTEEEVQSVRKRLIGS